MHFYIVRDDFIRRVVTHCPDEELRSTNQWEKNEKTKRLKKANTEIKGTVSIFII